MESAKLTYKDKNIELPVITGSEQELGIDISNLRSKTGMITLDDGYGNTGSCESKITYIDGEKGILRYRGYDIEDLAKYAKFPEVAYLLIWGELPNKDQLAKLRADLSHHSLIHENMKKFFEGFPLTAHPMSILSSMTSSLSAFYPSYDESDVETNFIRLLAKAKTIAAFSYKQSIGQPFIYPSSKLSYVENMLHMMFGIPNEPDNIPEEFTRAMNQLLILHADHEQNCSTSTVRIVGSSQANLFASISAGINALWGPLHGGANQKVIEMLAMIAKDGQGYKKYVELAKDKDSNFRLMGFGHRVYKNFDPRAKILKKMANEILGKLNKKDPLMDIAMHLEEVALSDNYFIERNLYPNVDFYSGIIYRAMGIPLNMFTVMFALGRIPGWIAHWKEQRDSGSRIGRPRQIYTGNTNRTFTAIENR